ncbi:hypothetical protein M9Y10_001039 [Tritrichomonas musculus]|uniref:DUF3447 domain-containing protein n=1 Tax=Tritrichomonas musculus TaxID=1915356 RepID=A0ABR2L5X4_9EUKA
MKRFIDIITKAYDNIQNYFKNEQEEEDDDEIKNYIEDIKTIQENILEYLESKQSADDELINLNYSFTCQEIFKDKLKFKMILRLISKIADNHNRAENLFQKIENFLKSNENEIKSAFSNDQIFHIFKNNKKILLFLFSEKIIIPNYHIFSIITNYKNTLKSYPSFFYPEFKSFFNDELIKKYNIDKIDPEEFEEKRQIGEREFYISKLIREDLIDEFIIYVSKTNISLSSVINQSIFETNNFLIDKTPTLIEYAAFFGSIQIFHFIRLNNIELTPSLWTYAIHGRNYEIIHLLEENHVFPSSYKECLIESIKCHHNEITDYIRNNYCDNNDLNSNVFIQSIKYYNFIYFSEKRMKQSKNIFYFLCKYDYCQLIKLLVDRKFNNLDINMRYTKKIDNKKDGYEKLLINVQYHQVEKQYQEEKTPLIVAVEKGNQEIVEFLLQQINIDADSKFESTFSFYSDGKYAYIDGGEKKSIIYIASEKGYSEIVQLLINRKNININEINNSNNGICDKHLSALHIAIENEDIEIIKILLNVNNIDTNLLEIEYQYPKVKYEKAPIIIAIEKNNSQIVQLLLSNIKTDPNLFYNHYTLGFVRGQFPCERYENLVEKLTPLQVSIEKENIENIQILLSNEKINVNESGFKFIKAIKRDDYHIKLNQSALHFAVQKNSIDIVQMLLSHQEIDVNSVAIYEYIEFRSSKTNKIEEKTALLIAVENDNYQITEELLKNKKIDKNKKLNHLSKEKQLIEYITAFDIAIQKRYTEIINILK